MQRNLYEDRWLSNSDLLVKHSRTPLSIAGNTVVSEVVTGGVAGALHDSALWLWRPKVLGAIANAGPPCNQTCEIASATVPAGTGLPAVRGTAVVFSLSFTPSRRPAFLAFPASGTPRR